MIFFVTMLQRDIPSGSQITNAGERAREVPCLCRSMRTAEKQVGATCIQFQGRNPSYRGEEFGGV